MRLDVFLKQSRLVPRRTVAQEMCEGGKVKLNGLRAKSAREVHQGDLLSIRSRDRETTARILTVPTRPPSKRDAATLIEILEIKIDEI
jgi:ribosomal 50S subunit-recycling heat shock protein